MPSFTDQTGRTIELRTIPSRIVSLVPSQTELLHYFGLEQQVAGITKFCVHPPSWFKTKTRVGGTKQLSIETIHALQPDLIIANKEENVKEQVEALAKDYPVWVSDVNNLGDAYNMITSIGEMVHKTEAAQNLINQIKEGFAALIPSPAPPRTAYLIWREPYMTIGGDTFIHDMLTRCGFENMFAHQTRYPTVTIQQLQQCQLLLLSSEPYPFKQQHAYELQQQLPGVKIMLADGEMFSWYGSRLVCAAGYFRELKLKVKSEK
jgi:ABC-type Fe3+-hydroxamate transport system substrate-binding protein